ncbi:MAG TPA: dihydrofolate reductase family protein [Acidimicrobiales bacterium]
MPKLRVHAVSTSLDGCIAGPSQSEAHPLGIGGEQLHEWIFATRSGRAMIGQDGGEVGTDDDFVAAGFDGIGATIMGRNMFGPIRGEWGSPAWTGWWGGDPPFHHDVFVLTHHPRPSLPMAGGTTFHFVTEGAPVALERAREAAGASDIRIGGGAGTIRAFLELGLVDEMHVAVVPVLLGDGECLFERSQWPSGYRCESYVATERAAHFRLVPR